MSGAASGSEPLHPETVETVQAAQQLGSVQSAPAAADEAMDISDSEEGEVDEESAHISPTHNAFHTNDGKIGSQATTVSGTSQPDAMPQIEVAVLPDNTMVTATDGAADIGAQHSAQQPANEDDEEMEMDEDSSDDEDDEDDDLDNLDNAGHGAAQPHTQTRSLALGDDLIADGDMSGLEEDDTDDTSSASATEPEDYVPEPVPGPISHPEVQPDESRAPATTNVIRATDAADDDLAPELQPLMEQQTAVTDQVRGDESDWSDIY